MEQLCTGYDSPETLSRRNILSNFGMGLGSIALSNLLGTNSGAVASDALSLPHQFPKARRVIFLFQSGGPSQMDLFDYKPKLKAMHGQQLPDSVRKGQRLTGMSGNQSSLPLVSSPYEFKQHGNSGAWMSDRLPQTAKVVDELCFIKSMYTEAINHGPGVTFMQTGSQIPGRPSFGAWLSYGLGSENENLPSFIVMLTKNKGGQPLVSRLWGSGFLPSRHQGVRFRASENPVLYLKNPPGVNGKIRRQQLDALHEIHEQQMKTLPDPEIETRIRNYELAFRMQTSIPEATAIKDEPEHTFKLYGEDARIPGTFAANCLQARRLAERGVRFIQLYHPGWDQHSGLPAALSKQCKETDQASAALIIDLKRRGLLEDTLVIWGGEFGRTNYCQGKISNGNFGRDHHPRCFTMWVAGGGFKGGYSHGSTDELCYNIEDKPVHVHDLHATLLNQLGMNHEHLTYRYQGRRFRLTDVHGKVIKELIS